MKFKLKEFKNSLIVTRIANVHFFNFKKNFYTEKDSHPFCELIFVKKGEVFVESDDFCGELKKNQMIIHTANMNHSFSCKEGSIPSVIIIGFECDSDNIALFSKEPITLDDYSMNLLSQIMLEGKNFFKAPYNISTYDMKKKKSYAFASEQLLQILLETFLIYIIRKYKHHYIPISEVTERFTIEDVINYVDVHYLEKLKIEELAFIFKTNRTTICSYFKKKTGKTIVEYIQDKKINLAKEKLLYSKQTISEISEELLFDSIHDFSHFFKSQTGFSPKAFRETNK